MIYWVTRVANVQDAYAFDLPLLDDRVVAREGACRGRTHEEQRARAHFGRDRRAPICRILCTATGEPEPRQGGDDLHL